MVHTSHRSAGGRADLASPDRLPGRNARSPSAHRGAHPGGHECPVCSAVRDHDNWNTEVRGETPLQRADRAYGEILQEIRVAQTGVQILFAFLLALAFTSRFGSVTVFQRDTYVVTLLMCAAATALLIAPAAFHRVVYRRRLKQHLVHFANRLALSGLVLLMLSLASAVLLILDVVLGRWPAVVMASGTFAWFLAWWFMLPMRSRIQHQAGDRHPITESLPDTTLDSMPGMPGKKMPARPGKELPEKPGKKRRRP
jgi:hypothetical protein